MEVMFLILSGVILAAGILYWFWSHIQLTQKKVQLLENAVFELRGMLAPTEIPPPESSQNLESVGQPQPQYTDLEDDDWTDNQDIRVAVVDTPVGIPTGTMVPETRAEAPQTVTVVREEPVKMTPEMIQGFTSLYTNEVKEVKEVVSKTEEPQTLEGMTIKELRRMASERGITGTAEMRKKELVAALRNSVNGPPESSEASEVTELTLEAF